jgi:Tol biopolymer transport system component
MSGSPLSRRLVWIVALTWFAGLFACVSTRLSVEELPEAPIAFLHWEDKAAKKRAEILGADEAPAPPAPSSSRGDPAAAEEREIEAYLQAERSALLAFKLSKNPGRLMLYWPRSEKLERVAAAPPDSRPLAWSRDHQRLLFVSAHRGGKEQLYEYDVQRKHLSVLTTGPLAHVRGDYDDSGRLAILGMKRSNRGGPAFRSVYIASSGGRVETPIPADIHPGTLRFSPAGDRIVYEQVRARPRSDGATTFESFIATRSFEPGAEEEILLRGREPSLTPDGDWIVFASPSTAGYRLRRMRPDGTSRVPIGANGPGGSDERMPSVSPDGEFIAFILDAGDSRQLHVRRFDGKRERSLVTDGWSEFPVW